MTDEPPDKPEDKPHDDPDDESARTLVEGLRRLGAEELPPPALEERLVSALRTEGRLGSSRRAGHPGRVAFALAASVLLAFVLGLVLGRRLERGPEAPAGTARFALFLYESPGPAGTPEESMARVEEYKAWARAERQAGHLMSGEKLADRGAILSGFGPARSREDGLVRSPQGVLSGYFIIRASGLEQALEVARDCPHLRHGGRIALRPIDPV